jgi:hypothetical protein
MILWTEVGVGKILSSIKAKNLAALTLTFILATSILSPVASASGGAEHPLGTDLEEWWTEYPDQHSEAGSAVDHPSWVLDLLEEKPVIIFIHKNNCPACVRQEADIKKVLAELGGEVAYTDLLIDSGDQRAWAGLAIYDPKGGIMTYVPVTVFLTLVPESEGDAEVAWHSGVGYSGERWVRSYLNDAIALHDENSAKWDR